MRALALLPAIILAAFAVEQPAIATTIGQAGSASLLPASAVEETAVPYGKVTQNFPDSQLPQGIELATDQPGMSEESAPEVQTVLPQAEPDGNGKQELNGVEQMPQFPGGEMAMMKYIADHLQYPADAMEAGDEGRVVVRFVVGADGTVRDATIIKGCTESLDAEALRVISALPAFIPGKNANGEPVAVSLVIPVNFKLQKDDTEAVVVEHYTGNLSFHPDSSKPQPAYFVNGKPFEGNIKDIASENIAEIVIIKNAPGYPNGKMDITLKDGIVINSYQ